MPCRHPGEVLGEGVEDEGVEEDVPEALMAEVREDEAFRVDGFGAGSVDGLLVKHVMHGFWFGNFPVSGHELSVLQCADAMADGIVDDTALGIIPLSVDQNACTDACIGDPVVDDHISR